MTSEPQPLTAEEREVVRAAWGTTARRLLVELEASEEAVERVQLAATDAMACHVAAEARADAERERAEAFRAWAEKVRDNVPGWRLDLPPLLAADDLRRTPSADA